MSTAASQANSAETQVHRTYDEALEEWCKRNKFTKVTHTTDDIDYKYKVHGYDEQWLHHNYVAIAYRKLRIRSSYYRAGFNVNQKKGADASSKEIIDRMLNTNVLDRYEEYRAERDAWINSMYGILRSFGLSPPAMQAKL